MKAKKTVDPLPVIPFKSPSDWSDWLEEHHAASGGLWIKFAKKNSGIESVTYAQALDVSLCHGWIDGQKASFDNDFWLQRFTRRGRTSKWSKINRDRATELIAQGRMQAHGLGGIESARRDGRWDAAYESQRSIRVPADLQERLDQDKRASEFFAGLDSNNRYAILYRIHDARKPETRARRIEKFVAMLSEGKTIH